VKTCFDCLWVEVDGGYHGDRDNPPEPATAECGKVTEAYLDELNELCSENYAERCRYFKAIALNRCPVCGFEFDNQPAYDWCIHAHGYDDPVAVCSEGCRETLQTKFDTEFEEEQRDYQEYYA
jgi:hypothetical protein